MTEDERAFYLLHKPLVDAVMASLMREEIAKQKAEAEVRMEKERREQAIRMREAKQQMDKYIDIAAEDLSNSIDRGIFERLKNEWGGLK